MVDQNRFLNRRVRTFRRGQEYRLVEAVSGGGHSYAYIGESTRERRPRRVFIKIPVFSVLNEREFQVHKVVSKHSNIATVLDWGTIDGLSFLVIEYLSGGTLEEALEKRAARWARGSWSLRQRLRAFDRLCSAVKYLHQDEYVHRDIKLANVLLRRERDISDLFLTDFSLARGPDSRRVTVPGTQEGTPGERAPEQVHGGAEITCQVDVFGLAYVLVGLLWGVRGARQLGCIVESTPRGKINFSPPKNRETAAIVPLLQRMVVRNPKQRPSVKEVQSELYRAYPQFFPQKQDSRQPRKVRPLRKRHKSPSAPNKYLLIGLICILSVMGATLILLGMFRFVG